MRLRIFVLINGTGSKELEKIKNVEQSIDKYRHAVALSILDFISIVFCRILRN